MVMVSTASVELMAKIQWFYVCCVQLVKGVFFYVSLINQYSWRLDVSPPYVLLHLLHDIPPGQLILDDLLCRNLDVLFI